MHSADRGREELTAEIGAAFLAAETGTRTTASESESANYVALSWLRAIKADKKLVVQAASAAQKAADLILSA